MRLTAVFVLLYYLIWDTSALRRQGPSVEIKPVLQNDNSDLFKRLDSMEAKIEASSKTRPAMAITPDNGALQNALATHSLRQQDDEDRKEEMNDLASKETDAKTEGKLKGLAKASLGQTKEIEDESSKMERVESAVEREAEKGQKAGEGALKREAEKEEDDEKDREEGEEEEEADNVTPETINESDLEFEDSNQSAIEAADKIVKKTDELNEGLDEKENALADKQLKSETKSVQDAEAETSTTSQTTDLQLAEGNMTSQDTAAAKAKTEGGPCPTGAIDHPCPCIEEMMKEPCPVAPEKKEGCKEILERESAEERLKGAEAKIKKIIKHKGMKGGPKVVLKKVAVGGKETGSEDEEGGSEDEEGGSEDEEEEQGNEKESQKGKATKADEE